MSESSAPAGRRPLRVLPGTQHLISRYHLFSGKRINTSHPDGHDIDGHWRPGRPDLDETPSEALGHCLGHQLCHGQTDPPVVDRRTDADVGAAQGSGGWLDERHIVRTRLRSGRRRGTLAQLHRVCESAPTDVAEFGALVTATCRPMRSSASSSEQRAVGRALALSAVQSHIRRLCPPRPAASPRRLGDHVPRCGSHPPPLRGLRLGAGPAPQLLFPDLRSAHEAGLRVSHHSHTRPVHLRLPARLPEADRPGGVAPG